MVEGDGSLTSGLSWAWSSMWSWEHPCIAPAALSGEDSGPQELCAAKGVCAFHTAGAVEPGGMAVPARPGVTVQLWHP